MTDCLMEAACAYVLARESGRLTTNLYRALRRAWVAKVRGESIVKYLNLTKSRG